MLYLQIPNSEFLYEEKHVTNPIIQVAPAIFQIQVPVPFPLKTVQCYLVREENGWTMIDTGLQYEPAHQAWAYAFQTLNIEPRALRQIIVTHAHPDHYGLAGHFQNLTGAPVYLLEHEIEIATFEWQADGERMDMLAQYFKRHGLASNIAASVYERQMQVLAMVQPQPVMSPLHEGATIAIGGEAYRIIWTPGHADGHIILQRADGLAFTGDLVLMKITPNIARWPGLARNPLGDYLASLDKVESLHITRALPGHRAIIQTWTARIAELRAHHAARLNECFNAARNCTAYQICLEVFPRLKSVDEMRLALLETLSHLEYLVAKGRMTRQEKRLAPDQEVVLYTARRAAD